MTDQSLNELLKQLKHQKFQKGEVARQFKIIEKGSDQYQALLEQMKLISAEIDNTEASIKSLQTTLVNQPTLPDKTIAFDFLEPSGHYKQALNCALVDGHNTDWQNFLTKNKHTPYHTTAWLNLIERVFNHPSKILLAQNTQGEILGGLPLTLFSSRLFGKFAVSIPFINYGGPLSAYADVNQHLIKMAANLLDELEISHIEIRSLEAGRHNLVRQNKASMILSLPASDDLLEKNLGAKVRAQYKKAEEYNPKAQVGKTELLNSFYQVFSRNMRDLGTPVYPKSFFAEILQSDQFDSYLLVVTMNEKPVSAAFLMGNNNVLEIPWASTIASANPYNMNMWMYRQILSFAISKGYDYFDFGRSTIDAGTYKFKKQWGAEPRQHYWYYLLPEGKALPEINPNNPKYKMFIALWKLMPVWLSRLIGPLLIKHIP